MSTRSPFDTPANGDFARYVEELTRQPALTTGMTPAPTSAPREKLASATAPRAPQPPGAGPRTGPRNERAKAEKANLASRAADLIAAKAAKASRPPAAPSALTTAPPAANPAQRPSFSAAPPVEAFKPALQLVRQAVLLWIAYSIAASFYAPLAVAGWPLVLAFLVWAGVQLKKLPWADLGRAMRMGIEEAEQAAKQKK